MMSTRNLILEMAVYSENDVFAMSPLVSLSSKETEELEDDALLQYVLSHIQSVEIPSNCRIQRNDIGVVIRHHCGHRNLKKAALLAIPYIMNSNLPTAPWRKKTDSNGKLINPKDKRLSGMMSAPILIDGTKYLCNLTAKKDKQGIISPYAITLKDEGGNIVEKEKMDSHCQVPNSDSEPTTSGNAHLNKVATSLEANPSSDTKITKESKTTKYMKQKKTITESQLRKMIAESVTNILKEYAGYDSEKVAYGEQPWGDDEYMNHLTRVAKLYPGGDGEDLHRIMAIAQARKERNEEGLDPLRLRLTNNPYRKHLDNINYAKQIKSNSMDRLRKSVTDSQLREMIAESVKNVLKENNEISLENLEWRIKTTLDWMNKYLKYFSQDNVLERFIKEAQDLVEDLQLYKTTQYQQQTRYNQLYQQPQQSRGMVSNPQQSMQQQQNTQVSKNY